MWLKYFTTLKPGLIFSDACSIEFEDKVIITGGLYSGVFSTKASVYNHSGFVADLADLNVPRYDHGCGSYLNENNQKVLSISYIIINIC